MTLFGEKIEKGINQWLDSFSALGQALGHSETVAIDMAKQSFVEVQGSLVLSKAMGSIEPFQQAMHHIRKRYTV